MNEDVVSPSAMLESVNTKVTWNDILNPKEDHVRIIQDIPGSFIVGSYLINQETANDIDIVIPYSTYLTYNAYCKDSVINGFTITSRDDAEYDRSDINCLIMTMRSPDRKTNLLIVADEYVAAYKGAVNNAALYPEAHDTRANRVDIYDSFERRVKVILSGE